MNRRIPTPAQFVNRELGILAFNRRVVAQAADDAVPLLERLRFITIVSSNLDEFFEIRVAGLKESIKLGLHDSGPDARSSAEVFDAVSKETHALVAEQYKLLNEVVLPSRARCRASSGCRRRTPAPSMPSSSCPPYCMRTSASCSPA